MISERRKRLKAQSHALKNEGSKLKKRIGNGQEAIGNRQIALVHCLPRVFMIAVFIMLVVSGTNLFLPVSFAPFTTTLSQAGTVDLPRTGQTTSYAAGDDGAIQAGVPWPAPRFTDNGDGTVTDNLTGLIWLKDAICLGRKTWQSALDTIADFNANPRNYNCQAYTASYTDWRLPNRKELHSLTDFSQFNPALPSGHPFTKVRAAWYWSSSADASGTGHAWLVYMWAGQREPRL